MFAWEKEIKRFLFDHFLYITDSNIFNEAPIEYSKVQSERYCALKSKQLHVSISQHDL